MQAPEGIYVRELGEGASTLLMVHGGPDWDHSFLVPAARPLSAHRRVMLFDLRGCGRSFRCERAGDYTREAAAGDLLQLARNLPRPIDLLGFSFGGRLAIRAAEREPNRFRSLILASTATRAAVSWDPEPAERARRRRAAEAELARLAPKGDPAAHTRALALSGLELDVWDRALIPRIRPIIEAVRFSGEWSRDILAAERPIDGSWLARSELPVLVVHGERDLRFPADDSAWLAAREGVRRSIIPDAGHLVHLEAPEAWGRAVADFLAERDATQPAP